MLTEGENLIIDRYVKGNEMALIESYIENGPTKTKKELKVSDREWQVIFDYMVFKKSLLYITVMSNVDFFTQEYISHGMAHIRDMLSVTDEKYDSVCRMIFDVIAVLNDALTYHVIENRDRYTEALFEHGTDFVRAVLLINNERYEEIWLRVLDLLLHAVCEDFITDRGLGDGIESFTKAYNIQRVCRPIDKSGLIFNFGEKLV